MIFQTFDLRKTPDSPWVSDEVAQTLQFKVLDKLTEIKAGTPIVQAPKDASSLHWTSSRSTISQMGLELNEVNYIVAVAPSGATIISVTSDAHPNFSRAFFALSFQNKIEAYWFHALANTSSFKTYVAELEDWHSQAHELFNDWSQLSLPAFPKNYEAEIANYGEEILRRQEILESNENSSWFRPKTFKTEEDLVRWKVPNWLSDLQGIRLREFLEVAKPLKNDTKEKYFASGTIIVPKIYGQRKARQAESNWELSSKFAAFTLRDAHTNFPILAFLNSEEASRQWSYLEKGAVIPSLTNDSVLDLVMPFDWEPKSFDMQATAESLVAQCLM
jgi:hypothetical protein